MAGITLAGGSGYNELRNPSAIFVTPDGIMYIVDTSNYRVQKWKYGDPVGVTVAGGRGLGSLYTQMGTSYGLYVDKQYNVWVSECSNHRVTKWTASNTATGARVSILHSSRILMTFADRFRWLVAMALVVHPLDLTVLGVFLSVTLALFISQITIIIGFSDGYRVIIGSY